MHAQWSAADLDKVTQRTGTFALHIRLAFLSHWGKKKLYIETGIPEPCYKQKFFPII